MLGYDNTSYYRTSPDRFQGILLTLVKLWTLGIQFTMLFLGAT